MGALPGLNESFFHGAQNYDASELCGCMEDCDTNLYQSEITAGKMNLKNLNENKFA